MNTSAYIEFRVPGSDLVHRDGPHPWGPILDQHLEEIERHGGLDLRVVPILPASPELVKQLDDERAEVRRLRRLLSDAESQIDRLTRQLMLAGLLARDA